LLTIENCIAIANKYSSRHSSKQNLLIITIWIMSWLL
jgi:hypothetical protein